VIRRGAPGDYQVAIPSYQRPAMVCAKTLPALTRGGVDPSRITVFLHAHDPKLDDYRTYLPANIGTVITDARGINAQRAAIIDTYGPGTPLVQVDDDLSRLVKAIDPKTTHPIGDVDAVLRSMFFETMARDLWVWGLSPTTNAFYMKPGRISVGLRFLLYSMVGTFTRPGHPVHLATVPTKDDYELSLRSWWYDGASVRADGVAAVADLYKAPGGCQLTRQPADAETAVTQLLATWPGLVRRNEKRNTGYPEIKLTPRPRHGGHPPTTPPPGLRSRVEV
jgi:hypothetical protein